MRTIFADLNGFCFFKSSRLDRGSHVLAEREEPWTFCCAAIGSSAVGAFLPCTQGAGRELKADLGG